MQACASFTRVSTNDGSPTIRMKTAEQPVEEDMHHSGGALAESIYNYADTISSAFDFALPARVLSVGLGIGYTEAVTVAEAIRFSKDQELEILSFEKDTQLRTAYEQWLQSPFALANPQDVSKSQANQSPPNFTWPELFNEVIHLVSEAYKIEAEKLFQTMQSIYQSKRWSMAGGLESFSSESGDYSVILFDAFSRKATPEIWTEEFLKSFLSHTAAESCFFSTYAAVKPLDRALESCGFTVRHPRGFHKKRDSTRAYRLAMMS